MRLGNISGAERLEAACRRACLLGACSYKRIASILNKGRDRRPLPEQSETTVAPRHAHIRGPQYDQDERGKR